MKILYLCPDLGIPVLGHKGAAIHVREMVSALGRAGHHVTLAAQILNKSPWETPAFFDTPLLYVRPALGASAAIQAFKEFNEVIGVENSLPGELRRILYNKELSEELKRRFENDPPDFIYERASLYATSGVTLAKIFGVPLLLEINAPLAVEQAAYRATGFGELAAHVERWALTRADAVLAVSNPLRNHVLSLGVSPDRVRVVPNGVNATLFRPGNPDPDVRRKFKLDGRSVLGFVGGLRPWHGIEILPDLLLRLNERQTGVQMVVAGDGQLRSELEHGFKKRGLERDVIFTGIVPHGEVAALVREFDIALAPYPRPEHEFYFSPLKLFEYMACGVAVVASNLGQISEVVDDGRTGLLYPPGDLDALTARCDELLASPARRSALGEAASTFVRETFTWDKNAERITALARAIKAGREA